MEKILISSVREGAGKTSIIAGIINGIEKKFGYIKPLGDRLIYRRKKSWDYDSNLIVNMLGRENDLESHSVNITLGFDHSKLRYMFDEQGTKKALNDMVKDIGKANDVLLIEGGRDLNYGGSIYLDPISVSKHLNARQIIIVSGDNDTIIDDIKFIYKYLPVKEMNLGGIIINKVNDVDEFEHAYLPLIKEMGATVLGIIPYKEQLTYYTVEFLAERLFAKVITGEKGLKGTVKNFVVGALSTADPMNNPLFTDPKLHKENQLMITGGDRSDMILAALEGNPIGIVLTNNIVPPQKVISKVSERNIPLLLVTMDTFQVAKHIDGIEALLRIDDEDKIKLLSQMAGKYIKINEALNI